jgi:hypothetical protein
LGKVRAIQSVVTAELLNRLQNGTHRGKEGAADPSVHGRMGLGTACEERILRMKNDSIESFGGKKLCHCVEENCVFTKKFMYTYMYMYYCVSLCGRIRYFGKLENKPIYLSKM